MNDPTTQEPQLTLDAFIRWRHANQSTYDENGVLRWVNELIQNGTLRVTKKATVKSDFDSVIFGYCSECKCGMLKQHRFCPNCGAEIVK